MLEIILWESLLHLTFEKQSVPSLMTWLTASWGKSAPLMKYIDINIFNFAGIRDATLSLSQCKNMLQLIDLTVSHNCFYYTSKPECAIPDDNWFDK